MSNRISYCRILTPQVVLLAASASLFAQALGIGRWTLYACRIGGILGIGARST